MSERIIIYHEKNMVKPPDLQYGPERKEHMKNNVTREKIISKLKAILKKLLTEHLNCTVWAAVGIYILVFGKIGRLQYFITWALLIVVMWRYMPDRQRTDMTYIVKRYPIGSKVRLSCDMPDDEPRTVQGYKQIGRTKYLILSDGHIACIERIEDGKRRQTGKEWLQKW